jgi:HD-like signal output (HDOD) protein
VAERTLRLGCFTTRFGRRRLLDSVSHRLVTSFSFSALQPFHVCADTTSALPKIHLTSERLLLAAQRLPSAPRAFGALEAILRDPDVAIDAVVDVVRVDTSLAARVIRVANSPVFRRGSPATNLDEAIGRIGLREIHRLVGAAVAEQLFAVGLPLYRVGGDELWVNAVASALAAEHIALLAGQDSRQAYTVGILRSAGRMLLQRLSAEAALPPASGFKENGTLTRAWELDTFGITADEAGARLLKLWDFPPVTTEALRHAFKPEADPARRPNAALLHLAGWVTDTLGKGLTVEIGLWSLQDPVLAQAGIDAERVQSIVPDTRNALNRTINALRPPAVAA